MQDRLMNLRFPLGGLHKSSAYQAQPPFTTPDCLNVRPRGVFEERQRGGSRPGLGKAYYEDLGGPVRMLASVPIVRSDGYQTWIDNFQGTALGSGWTAASWIGAAPTIWRDEYASTDNAGALTRQDYTGYTKKDTDPSLTVTANKCAVGALVAADSAWICDDKGAGHFGTTFTHTVKTTPQSAEGDVGIVWAVANEVESPNYWLAHSSQALGVWWDPLGWTVGVPWLLKIRNYETGLTASVLVGTGIEGTPHYLVISRSPSLVTCKVYSDAAHTTLLQTLTIAVDPERTYRHVFGASTYLAQPDPCVSLTYDVENLVLTEDGAIGTVGAVRDSLSIDVAQPYELGLFLTPYLASYHGTHSIFFRLDDTTPALLTAGVRAELTMANGDGTYSGALTVYPAGTTYPFSSGATGDAEAGWFNVVVNGNNVKVYWLGTEILDQDISAPAGQRFGFGLDCTEADGLCLAGSIRADYYSGSGSPRQNVLAASAGGKLYRTTDGLHLNELVASPTIASDRHISAVSRAQKLYIADYGDVKVTGADGAVAANGVDLSAVGVADWTALGLDTDDDVCVVSNGTGAVADGTYAIASVVAAKVTLVSTTGGSGTCTYRIERAPKVFDPLAGSLSVWAATAGQVPTGCPCMAVYRDRAVVAGNSTNPHLWYMSRQSDFYDFNFGADPADAARAIGSATGYFGKIGDPITAVITHNDDYLLFGCDETLWVLRGDPTFGGEMDNVSQIVGVVGQSAWCQAPDGATIILSHRGLYRVPPGGAGSVEPLSSHLPQELRHLNALSTVSLAHDNEGGGIHIYVTPEEASTETHWWFDLQRGSFWPMRLPGDFEPTAVCAYHAVQPIDSAVLLGGRDGYVRRYRLENETDEGAEIESYVDYGPIATSSDKQQDGLVVQLVGNLAEVSGDVAWSLHVGHSEQDAALNDAAFSGTWEVFSHGGVNYTNQTRARGRAYRLRLANGATDRAWSVETVRVRVRTTGPHKLL